MARIALPSLANGPAESAHSGIREIANEALRTPGAIRLDVGQPDFPTPQHVKDAGKRAIDENKTFYTHTQGLMSLREKLVDKLARMNGIKSSPEAIACAPGGVGAIAAMFAAVLAPGDEVLLPDPGWPNYRIDAALARRPPIVVSLPAIRRIPARPRGAGGIDHAAYESHGRQQPQQSDRRGLSGRHHRGDDRARPAQQPVAAQRRVLRPDPSGRQLDKPSQPCAGRRSYRDGFHLLQDLFDDRLAPRLPGRVCRAGGHRDQGPRVELVLCIDDQPGRG